MNNLHYHYFYYYHYYFSYFIVWLKSVKQLLVKPSLHQAPFSFYFFDFYQNKCKIILQPCTSWDATSGLQIWRLIRKYSDFVYDESKNVIWNLKNVKCLLEIQEFFKYPFCTAVNHWTSSIIRSSVLIKWFIRSTDIFMIYLVIYTNYLHTLAELQGASTDFAMVPPPSSSPPIPKKSLNQSYNWKWQLKLNLPF